MPLNWLTGTPCSVPILPTPPHPHPSTAVTSTRLPADVKCTVCRGTATSSLHPECSHYVGRRAQLKARRAELPARRLESPACGVPRAVTANDAPSELRFCRAVCTRSARKIGGIVASEPAAGCRVRVRRGLAHAAQQHTWGTHERGLRDRHPGRRNALERGRSIATGIERATEIQRTSIWKLVQASRCQSQRASESLPFECSHIPRVSKWRRDREAERLCQRPGTHSRRYNHAMRPANPTCCPASDRRGGDPRGRFACRLREL